MGFIYGNLVMGTFKHIIYITIKADMVSNINTHMISSKIKICASINLKLISCFTKQKTGLI